MLDCILFANLHTKKQCTKKRLYVKINVFIFSDILKV